MTQLLEKPKPPSRSAARPSEARVGAIGRQERKREFHAHLAAYVMANGVLWLAWAVVLPLGGPWFPWPLLSLLSLLLLLGWGIGLAVHAWEVYGPKPFSVEEVEREVSRRRRRPPTSGGSPLHGCSR